MVASELSEEREAIHHVDSAFGIVLAITVFQSNLLISILGRPNTLKDVLGIFALAAALIFSVFAGLVGIFRQSWRWKLFAWNVTLFLFLYVFLMPLFMLLGFAMEIELGSKIHVSFFALLFLCSSLFTRYLVSDAYERRLLKIDPQGVQLAILRHWKKLLVSFGMTVFGVLLAFAFLLVP